MINSCWRLFKVALGVALLIAVATCAYLYVRMDDEIRAHVEGLLSSRYPQLRVSVGGARIIEGKGIAVYDLTLATNVDGTYDGELLAIDELLLCCDVDLPTLVKGPPAVHRVEVKRPQVFLRRSSSGRWNIESLLPIEPCGAVVPHVFVRGGVITVIDGVDDSRQPVVLRDVELSVAPVAGSDATAAMPSLQIEGSAGGPHVRKAEIRATVDGKQGGVSGELRIQQLHVAEQLHAWIEPLLPAIVRTTRLTGTIDGKVAATCRIDGAAAPDISAQLTLSDGRLDDPRLSRPVTALAGRIVADGSQLRVEQLQGKWDAAVVALSLNRSGWSATAPIALSARIDDVPLDEQLQQALATAASPKNAEGLPIAKLLLQECRKYQPTGMANATLQATYQDGKWKPTAELQGRQLAFESDKFAYRLTDGAGTITFTAADGGVPPKLQIALTAVGGGQRLQIDGEVIDPRPGAAGWLQVMGEGLEIEDRMIAALKDKPREVIASLQPKGKFNLTHWRIDRPHPGAEPQTSLRLDLTDIRVNYEHFPYALREIRGVIEAKGNHWTFTNLVSGGRRTIFGEGFLRPGPEGNELSLTFTGQNVPLDDNLFYAVQAPVQQAWRQLRPTGAINLRAEIRHRVGQGKPNIGVMIQPAANTSLRPEFFSYLLDDLSGTITYNDGAIALHEVRARDDSGASLGANGTGQFSPAGGWEFTLTGLWADRITTRLLAAMPPSLSRVINQLRPTGTFSLHDGQLSFSKPASEIAPLVTTWDVQLESLMTDLSCGVDLHNIHGSVRLMGKSDGLQCTSFGQLNLETVTYQDVVFTNVQGPIWFDESQCLLGKWATDKLARPVERVTANLYGGAVAADGWVQFGSRPQYGADAALTGADLSRLMVERFGGRQSFQGKVDGTLMLRGEGSSTARLTGEGKFHVREADIYELPLLMGLLKTLRTGAPDKTAFTESDIQFRIQGPHVYLDKIDFLGDVVDLYGYGETDFDQKVKLIFRGEFGPREYHIPLVKNFVGQASSQFMQMYVDGTLTEPHVTTEAFPGINQMLKQLRVDLDTPVGATATRQAHREGLFGR